MALTSEERRQQPEVRAIDDFGVAKPEKKTLKNGIPLYLIDAGEQEVVRLDVIIESGQWQEELPLQALFTNRMLREGTAKYTSEQFSEQLDYYGAWLELSSSYRYNYITLYSLKKYFKDILPLLVSMLTEPVFPEEAFFPVLQSNKSLFLVNSKKVGAVAQRLFNNAMFGAKHPNGRLIQPSDYDALNVLHLSDFFHNFYRSQNCTLFLSGKLDEGTIGALENALGDNDWGKETLKVTKPTFEIHTTATKRITKSLPNTLQSSIKIGSFAMNPDSNDYCDFRFLCTLLGGYFGSRLMANIREQKGYTYGIWSGLVPYCETSLFLISTEAANVYVDALITEVYNEMERLKKEPVSLEELNRARNYTYGELCCEYEGAFALADAFISMYTCGQPFDSVDKYRLALQNITSEKLLELSNRYFNFEGMREVIVGR